MVAILVLLTIITCLTIDYLAERSKLRRVAFADASLAPQPVFVRTPVDLTRVPADSFVGPGHAWMALEPTGEARVGVDRLPIVLLGGVEEIEAAPAGTEIHQGDRLARLRQGERSIEVKSPVDGRITAVNSELTGAALEKEPFADGWLVKLAPRNLGAAVRQLFVAEEAREFLRKELANLRDYLAGFSLAGQPSVAMATLPEGGLPVEGLAGRMTEEEWQQLMERFF